MDTEKKWATPILKTGLPNLHKISDVLYRGGQPTRKGFLALRAMGIHTVINLRSFHSDFELMKSLGMKYIRIPATTWHFETEDVLLFLMAIRNKDNYPIYFHCQWGADRTGVMCAIYRIADCGWSKAQAIDEMVHGGFGFHAIWGNLVEYVKGFDVTKVTAGTAGTKRGYHGKME